MESVGTRCRKEDTAREAAMFARQDPKGITLKELLINFPDPDPKGEDMEGIAYEFFYDREKNWRIFRNSKQEIVIVGSSWGWVDVPEQEHYKFLQLNDRYTCKIPIIPVDVISRLILSSREPGAKPDSDQVYESLLWEFPEFKPFNRLLIEKRILYPASLLSVPRARRK